WWAVRQTPKVPICVHKLHAPELRYDLTTSASRSYLSIDVRSACPLPPGFARRSKPRKHRTRVLASRLPPFLYFDPTLNSWFLVKFTRKFPLYARSAPQSGRLRLSVSYKPS